MLRKVLLDLLAEKGGVRKAEVLAAAAQAGV